MSSVRTFANQDNLPRLPIPSLQETADKFITTLQPFDKNQVSKTEKLVNDFIKPGGIGEVLQKRLIEHDSKQKNSWLETWWLEYAYHRYREPVLINVNWYCLAKEEPNAPKLSQADNFSPFSQFQIKRAAHLTSKFLEFWQRIEREEIPVEFSGKSPLCMNQFKCMFGVTRIPKKECDKVDYKYPCVAKYVTVLVKNQLYRLPVFDKSSGKRISIGGLEKLLVGIIEDVKKSPPSSNVCLLTAGHRDTWSEAREALLKISPENSKIFQEIEDSLFFVSLDDYATDNTLSSKQKNIFIGKNANNRWFDAALSLVIDAVGTAGLNGEHSPLDALIPAMVLEYAVKQPFKINTEKISEELPSFKRHEFKVNDQVKELINKAKSTIDETIKDSDSDVLVYSSYGPDFIKKIAKTSPDAYIQMAIQLAHFHLHGKCVATYESGSTRQFKHGRTETIRSLSSDSLEFCQAMKDASIPSKKKYMLLQKAVKSHLNYAKAAAQGKGVDRHLLGLKLCLKPGESHELFSDPLYNESQSWKLSTSSMFKTDNIRACGFGAVDPNGYGMNYIPSFDGKRITFGVESKHSSTITNTAKFISSLTWCFDELKKLCETISNDQSYEKSHL